MSEKFGVHFETIASRREWLGIKAHADDAGIRPRAGRPQVKWFLHDHLLGTERDHVVAERLGISTDTVHKRRRRLGIPSVSRPTGVLKPASRVDWGSAYSLWGSHSDLEIAKFLGCCPSHVFRYRKRMEIQAFAAGRGPRARFTGVDQFWKPAAEWWGRVSDREISKRLGCAPATVRAHRLEHGIPSFSEHLAAQKQAFPVPVGPRKEFRWAELVPFAATMDYAQIRVELCIPQGTVSSRVRRLAEAVRKVNTYVVARSMPHPVKVYMVLDGRALGTTGDGMYFDVDASALQSPEPLGHVLWERRSPESAWRQVPYRGAGAGADDGIRDHLKAFFVARDFPEYLSAVRAGHNIVPANSPVWIRDPGSYHSSVARRKAGVKDTTIEIRVPIHTLATDQGPATKTLGDTLHASWR